MKPEHGQLTLSSERRALVEDTNVVKAEAVEEGPENAATVLAVVAVALGDLLVAAAKLGLTADVLEALLLRGVLVVAGGGDGSSGESQGNGSDGELHFDGGKGCLSRTQEDL